MRRTTSLLLTLLTSFSTVFIVNAQDDQINLIAFKSNGQNQPCEVIKWNVDNPDSFTSTPSNVVGILVGTSTFNASTGDYISRVIQSGDPNSSGIFKYNANTQAIDFSTATSFFNGSAECDMSNGFIYTYDGNEQNEVELNKNRKIK